MGKYDYTNAFNKQNYKTYSFRVRKDNLNLINKLDNVPNRNDYITSLLNNDLNPNVLTIKQIRTLIKPVMEKHHINEVYLFGSYARNEAKNNSDVDLLMDTDITGLAFFSFVEELRIALHKKVDVVRMMDLSPGNELVINILKEGVLIKWKIPIEES